MKEFQNIFFQTFIIIFRPKILFFGTYSILTGQTKVEFVIYILGVKYSPSELFHPVMLRVQCNGLVHVELVTLSVKFLSPYLSSTR